MIDLISYAQPATDTLPPPEAPSDARELLSRFAVTGEQEPFEEVVRRYGGMVYNLCYEVTGNRQDAEDAVQAAFMSLALQVRGGQTIQAIGPWLQQVARRMSLDINRSRKRRKKREEKHGEAWEARQTDVRADAAGGAGSHGNPASAAGWEELRHIVQAELNEMPAKYRMPLILHYYGGMSRDEMARELNCRTNTLGVRLHRGREMLGKRLAKRGITLSGVMLGLIMGEVVHSVVSQRLIEHTAQAAVLVSAGNPFACGVVSPQIVALAHSAGRALANAKIRLAATLALMAGGAAAAGAQVVSHVGGAWGGVETIKNWDFSRAFRWLFHPPKINVDGMRVEVKPAPASNTSVATGPRNLVIDPNGPIVQPPLPMPEFPPRPYNPGALTLDLRSPQVPPIPQGLTYPPVPWNAQPDSNLPTPVAKDFNLNRGAPSVGGGGGSGILGGGGGSDTDVATRGRGSVPRLDIEAPVKGSRTVPDASPEPDQNIAQRPTKSTRPDGSGSSPSNNGGNKSDPSKPPKGAPQTTPDGADPGVYVNPNPTPLPGDPKGAAQQPPIIGPAQPPPSSEQPTPTPGKRTGDATGTGMPQTGGTGSTPGGTPSTDNNTPSAPTPAPQAAGGFLSDVGDLYVTNPYNPAGPESFDALRAAGAGNANFLIGPGATLVSKYVLVGHVGAGVATQTGGLHTVDSLYIASVKTGRGLYQMTGGELRVTASPAGVDVPSHSVDIGGAGEGTFLLGDATSTGTITQTADGGPVDLRLGVTRSGKGTLRGWGQVQFTGVVTNNGKVIADGYGQERSLDLTTFGGVTNSRANVGTAGNGWYAVNKGKLELPAVTVTKANPTATWGQGGDSTSLTYVNSARLSFKDVQTDGVVKVALLALDRTDLPTLPTGHHFIGTWSLDTGTLTAGGGVDLSVRYDDALAAEKGLEESVLKLWRYVDGRWERLDHDPTFVRDTADHTLSVHTEFEGVGFFAVSAPEPGSVGLIMVVSGLGLAGRRRRR